MASLNAPESSAAPEDNSADDYVLSMNMGGVLEEQAGALESTATSGAGTLAACPDYGAPELAAADGSVQRPRLIIEAALNEAIRQLDSSE